MKTKFSSLIAGAAILALLGAVPMNLPAATAAYWRFEEGPADANVVHGGLPAGVFYPGVLDSSGNGNALSVWAEGWAGYGYRADVPNSIIPTTGAVNNFSVQNTGDYPAMFTQTGSAIQSMTPAAFTIEASFKPETGSWRTMVGRDSYGTYSGDPNLAALYLQVTPDDAVAIKFCDVSGYWHQAISASGIVQGFNRSTDPNGLTGRWYHLAAVSDGSTLSLYLNSGVGFELVGQTDMTLSGSPNTALTAGVGDGADWDAGNWSVGRGLYGGVHVDRAYGFMDEVRISDSALTPTQFLFAGAALKVINLADAGPGSLRAALAAAANGDTVTCSVTGTITLTSGQLTISNNVSIVGPGAGALTISGNRASRVFNVAGNATISGLTIADGYTTNSSGAGLYAGGFAGSIVTVRDCVVTNNSTHQDGGGIYVNSGVTMSISNCIISGNSSADAGGGICSYAASADTMVTISASTLSGNSAAWGGGGICNVANPYHATLIINASTLTGNSGDIGGGIQNNAYGGVGTVTINTSTFSTNSASPDFGGGGINNFGVDGSASVTINASTFSGNAAGYGAAICNYARAGIQCVSLKINASTFSGNSATGYGGGLGGTLSNMRHEGTGTLEIGDTILNAGASGANIFNVPSCIITSHGYNLSSDDGMGFLTATGDQTNTVPQLGPLQSNGGPTWTCALLSGSPAIDRGHANAISGLGLSTDQRGFTRSVDFAGIPNASGSDGSDIGALEAQVFGGNPPLLTGPMKSESGSFQFAFTNNIPGVTFTVFTATNLALPFSDWTVLGVPVEIAPGRFQFTDAQATNAPLRFYHVTSP